MKILMFSGGMDSTYLAWKLLSENEDRVHIHHVSIKTDLESGWKKQDIVVKDIVNYLRQQGFIFDYSESAFELFNQKNIGWDTDVALLAGQKIACNCTDKYIEIVLGWNPFDLTRSCVADRNNRKVSQNIWKALVESTSNRVNINSNIQFPLVDQNINKDRMFKEMPQKLIDLSWSCRSGDDVPCGWCHSCMERNNALINISK